MDWIQRERIKVNSMRQAYYSSEVKIKSIFKKIRIAKLKRKSKKLQLDY